MDLRIALGTMHDCFLKSGDPTLEQVGMTIRNGVESRQTALEQVLAQVRRDDSGHFFVSAEAEDILRSAAALASIPWKQIDPRV